MACLVACITAVYVVFVAHRQPDFVSDFDQVWYGARVLRDGGNPYHVIGPGRAINLKYPLYYPLPAILLITPLSWLPVVAARALFMAISAGVLCFVLTEHDYTRLPLFLSGAFLQSALNVQWSPLLMCAALLPGLGFALAAKPTMGLAGASMYQSRRAVLMSLSGAALLTFVSLALLPSWPISWINEVRASPHYRPYVTHVIGWPLLLAALRWRRPEARMLLIFAVVPQTPHPYESVWAFFVSSTFRQSLSIAIATHAVRYAVLLGMRGAFGHGYESYLAANAWALLLLVYLPCLWLVLRRPNESPEPRATTAISRGDESVGRALIG